MTEAAKIYYIICPKGKHMPTEISEHVKNENFIISRNYCTEAMHVPPWIETILMEPVDFTQNNLIVLTIGKSHIKKEIQHLKNYIHKFNKPTTIKFQQWRTFKKRLLAYMVMNYFGVETHTEASELIGHSYTLVYIGQKYIDELINNPDPDLQIFRHYITKAINYRTAQQQPKTENR